MPSITETLFAFGLGDAVAGVTRFCVEPPAAVASLPKVGGTRDAGVDLTLALRPDLVIANVEENERETIERLIEAGIPVFVTYPRTVAQGIEMMRQLAALLGCARQARPVIVDAERELQRALKANEQRSPVRVFCPIWRNPRAQPHEPRWMTIGADTYMHDFLRVCGAENVFTRRAERYPSVTVEDVAAAQPEVILLPDEPYRFRQRHVPELEALEEAPAVRQGRIHLVEGKQLSWYGCRIGPSLRSVRELLWSDGERTGWSRDSRGTPQP